ncbi:DNA adenine methylase [Cupriavidus sp. SK-3]|uniref:DNA adenine methylase n=1 Tax=Cupriavidus sp. SK-3 TaxID=1470558 RepID=UPI0009DFEFF3|nr:DNA adenine methylase [Cupriavidus sp. SK-3]
MSRHKTPLRYPGGKQRLTPFVLELLEANDLVGGNYVEPYAGGAGVAMELLLNGHVKRVHLNDSSFPIYAFWRSVVTQGEEFCRRISTASLTIEEWRRQQEIIRNAEDNAELDVGFAAFYLNRCNRSGVLSGGVIGGLAQQGRWKIDARFPRNELINRVEAISERASSIVLTNLDAERFIKSRVRRLGKKTFVYCDPPYYEKSSRLYLDRYQKDDHARIAQVIQESIPHKWIVSYDGAQEILECYKERRYFLYDLQYNASRVYKGCEVFVFSDDLVVPRKSVLPYIDSRLKKLPPANCNSLVRAA